MTYHARVIQCGWTRDADNGHGSGVYPRWGLVPVDGKGAPVLHWRDGKVRHVGPRVSGVQPPLWLRRAAAFVASVGPLQLHELADVAEWHRVNARRRGGYPLDRLEQLAAK